MSTSPATENTYPQLLSLAVHEFRTPVSIVGGYLRMLERDTESTLTERQRKMIDEAQRSCGRLVDLIAELSDFSKLDAGLSPLVQQRLDLFTLIGEVAAGVDEAKDRDVHLEVRGDETGAPLNGDAARLRTAFNAIFRAILREKPGSSTVIAERRIEKRDGRPTAVVVVAEASSVQTAYEQTPGPFYEKHGGLGLALPIARLVIERHGGSVSSPAWDNSQAAEGEPVPALTRGSAIISLPVTE